MYVKIRQWSTLSTLYANLQLDIVTRRSRIPTLSTIYKLQRCHLTAPLILSTRNTASNQHHVQRLVLWLWWPQSGHDNDTWGWVLVELRAGGHHPVLHRGEGELRVEGAGRGEVAVHRALLLLQLGLGVAVARGLVVGEPRGLAAAGQPVQGAGPSTQLLGPRASHGRSAEVRRSYDLGCSITVNTQSAKNHVLTLKFCGRARSLHFYHFWMCPVTTPLAHFTLEPENKMLWSLHPSSE